MRAPSAFFMLLAAALPAQGIDHGPWTTPAKIPDGWVVHNTRYYHVQSQCGPEKAKRLGDHMEVMNAVYRKLFKPDKDGAKQSTIKLFKDQESYLAYGRKFGVGPGAAAYYSPDIKEMVCYDTGKWMDEKKVPAPTTGPVTGETPEERIARLIKRGFDSDAWKMDLLGVAAHEGWHQYYHWLVVSRVQLPSWINEGMGDYFYTAAPDPEKGKKNANLGNIFDGRLSILKSAKRQDRMEPLPRFLEMLQQDYYANPSICYAQGWAFCQFLLHGEKGKYAKVIPTYVKLLCNDTNWQSVQAKAFKGLDLAVMEKEFHAFVDSMKSKLDDPVDFGEEGPPTPPAPPAAPGSPAPGTPTPTNPPAGTGTGG
jgi:hypothetical protein